jgi:hypothetical protein
MLTYLFILFVVVLALAPLTHFLPSKRQRKLVKLREYAAVHGLFVELRSLPGAERLPRPDGEVIYYGKRLVASRVKLASTAAWQRTQDGWRGVGTPRAAPAILQELPPQILAASMDSASCGAYWTESGEEDTVEQIKQVLERWSSELMI